MGEIRTPLAENWNPHQVSVEGIMSEIKDKCFALFGASENYPWHGSAARVGNDNHALETHTLMLSLWKEQCFHYTLPSVFLHLVSSEQTCEEDGPGVIIFLWKKRKQVRKAK